EHDPPHADAAADVPVDRIGYFFHEFRSNRHASGAAAGSQNALMPAQFDGVMAPYSAKAAQGIPAGRFFP
ncbi:MAG: hypothetical protein ACREDH_15455, partial [Methylocella sp.]